MNYVGRAPSPTGTPTLVGDTNPVGMIAYFHTPPDGSYLRLNGQIVSKAGYPDLWNYAQPFLTADQVNNPGLYRSVDASTFAVPKLDGLFIRSQGTYDANRVSGALGAFQQDQMQDHLHVNVFQTPGGTTFFGSGASTQDMIGNTGAVGGSVSGGAARKGTESRGSNVALVPCVKALSTVLVPSTFTVAGQADMESAAGNAKLVTPGNMLWHPLMPKAWAQFSGALVGTNPPNAGFNVTSITRNGVGNYTVNFTTPFSSGTYGFLGTCESSGGITLRSCLKLTGGVQTTTQFQLVTQSVSDVASAAGVDAAFITVAFFGDQ